MFWTLKMLFCWLCLDLLAVGCKSFSLTRSTHQTAHRAWGVLLQNEMKSLVAPRGSRPESISYLQWLESVKAEVLKRKIFSVSVCARNNWRKWDLDLSVYGGKIIYFKVQGRQGAEAEGQDHILFALIPVSTSGIMSEYLTKLSNIITWWEM